MTNIDIIIIFVGSCIDIFRLWVPSYIDRLDPVAQFKDPCTIWVTVNVAGWTFEEDANIRETINWNGIDISKGY